MTLLAGFQVLLSRQSGAEDLAVGSPIAGRTHRELEGLIGFFVNTLVLRGDLSGDPRFAEHLSRVRTETLAAYAHQDLPFEKLVEELAPARNLSHTPLFQVVFVLQNAPMGTLALPGLKLSPMAREASAAKFDLVLALTETADGLAGFLEYDAELFDATTIQHLVERFERLLACAVGDPERRVGELPLLAAAERHQLVVEWNATATGYPRDVTLAELFAWRAARHPGRPALSYGGVELTYAELARRAGCVASLLSRRGVAPGDLVAIAMERSASMVAALLGIVEAGAAYLPLDAGYPQERLELMLSDSGTALLLADGPSAARLTAAGVEAVVVDGIAGGPAEEGSAIAAPPAGAASLAYVIYTSGSTGAPKGVAVTQRAVVRLIEETDYVELGQGDRIAQLSNVSFDAATFEIWGALLRGGTLVGVPQETLLSPRGLARFLAEERIGVLFLTTALFNQVAREAPEAFGGLRYLLFGGEAADPGVVRRVLASAPPERLLHVYGPTENTTFSTWFRVEEVAEDAVTVPIGRPIANSRLYLLDRRLEPVPLGVTGELYLGGDGLARGYLNRPELTAERFVESPALPGERLYRTGDLARLLPDGSVEFRCRADQQVKLRGFRIELGEIEAALAEHAGVAEAAVVLREDLPAGRGLIAYVASEPGGDLSAAALRVHLATKLPEYMVPAHVVPLAALPLTPNGKVDRRWLAEQGPLADERQAGGAAAGQAPRTPAEELVAGIFAELLGVEGPGAEADFFELGGHSLLATQFASRLREAFAVELPLRAIFEQPTVAGLARAVDDAARAERGLPVPPLAPAPRDGELPLSFAQQRLWFIHQMSPESPAYNMALPLQVDGALDVALLSRVLSEVVRRHETLRTRFVASGGRPLQAIDPPAARPLPVVDLRGLPAAALAAEAARLQREEAVRPFDLARAAVRMVLLRLGEESWVAFLTMHHIVSDGWSMGVLVGEVSALYRALSEGGDSGLPELPIQYADFAAWQRGWLAGEVLSGELGYWRGRLAGLPALLELPFDRPRPEVQGFHGASVAVALPRGLSRDLAALSRRRGATVFMTLLAGFSALLSRLSGQEAFALGSPIAGRTHRELEGLIGFFVNTLVLRADLSGDPRFGDLLSRAREETLDAYAHQDLPFEKLVEELAPERSLAHTPLFQAMLVLQNAPLGALRLPGLTLTPLDREMGTAPFDLTWMLTETPEGLRGFAIYNTDLFDPTTIERLAGRFSTLLAAAAAAPKSRVAELPLLDAAERHELLREWSPRRPAVAGSLPELFAEQVDRRPAATALISGEERLTYAELEGRANRLAAHLARLGVGPEVPVGLCLERSADLVVGMLGILKAGGAYVPLDPAYPDERLALLVEDLRMPVVVGRGRRLVDLALPGAPRLVLLDEEGEAIARRSAARPRLRLDGESLAYVLYTSGSTGRPKGVAVPHRAVARLVREADYARFGEDEVFLQLAPASFDASTLEIWGPLLNGGRLVLPPPGPPSLEELGRMLATHGVTTLWLTAGLFHEAVEEASAALRPLRQLLAGGDVLRPRAVRRALAELPGLTLVNGYGPTENTTFTCCHPMHEPPAAGAVPIGRPISGTEVYLVDASGRLAPAGVAGELLAGGAGLGRGYVGLPELTAERWIPDGVSGRPGERLYRTGDLARWRADGTLEFLGRLDGQVKVRGFRIEPGEVESALAADGRVREAVVVAEAQPAGEKRLVAYVVLEPGASLTAAAMREHLGRRLPEHMIPAALVVLDALPLTPNGKVDRRALPSPETPGTLGTVSATGFVALRTPAEEILAAIWSEVLGVERVGARDNFFDLGGHSLLATRVMSQLRAAFGVELPLREIFEEPTVAGLAERVEREARAGGAPPAPPIERAPREGELPLSFAQERLWFIDQLGPGSPLYNIPLALRAAGRLSAGVLSRVLTEVACRHEALRTVFAADGGRPRQVILPPGEVALPRVDLSALPPAAAEREAAALAAAEAERPFDLARGPLFRALVAELGEDDHVVLLTLHHIVGDGWSMGVWVREVAALYEAFSMGLASPLLELPVQYADFAVWQRRWLSGEVLARELGYWRERLSGVPALLDLPLDRPRPALQSYRGRMQPIALGVELTQALSELSRTCSATLFMTLLAGFQVLLSRQSGEEDLAVGSPIAGRTHRELEGLIGFFVNTLVLRGELAGDPRFAEHLSRVRSEALAAYAHQDLPFEKLVEELAPARSLAHTPLFQVLFVLQNAPMGPLELPGLTLTPLAQEASAAKFDLVLALTEGAGGLAGFVEHDAALFDRTTVERLAGQLSTLLRAAAAAPEARLSELPLLGPAERQQLVVEWRDGGAMAPPAATVPALLALQAAGRPQADAVLHGGERLSHGELDRRAAVLAARLRSLGAGRESRVALLAERSLDLVVGLFGIWKAGAAAVPLDPAQPRERLAWLVEDAAPVALVAQHALLETVAGLPVARTPVAWLGEGEGATAEPPAEVREGDLAYLIYTSGTTGAPKAVMVEHGGLRHTLSAVQEVFGFRAGDRMPVVAPSTFDIFFFELLTPLLAGGAAALADLRPALDVPRLVDELAEATHLHAVPALMRQVVAATRERRASFPRLRQVFVGGDAVPPDLLAEMAAAFPGARVAVLYGPTEGTILASWDGAGPGAGSCLGRPLPGVALEVRDRRGETAPIGVAGELWIGGPGVARGYLGRPELTAERFVPDPSGAGARLYRTGDLARFTSAGRLEFLGRADQQVKVRGFRIEPGEVEAALREDAGVRQAAVVVREVDGDRRLVAYVVLGAGESLTLAAMRERLSAHLPEHMIPTGLVVLDALPLTANGKVDRRALPAPELAEAAAPGAAAPRTPTEEVLAAIWGEVLGIERVGVFDNFFDLGGHSLLATRVISQVRGAFQAEIGLQELFEEPTVAALAARVERAVGAGAGVEAPPIKRVPRDGELPLSFAQQRLWFIDQLEPESPAYNMPMPLRLAGRLDRSALERSLAAVVARHEALRTRFPAVAGRPVQVIDPPPAPGIPLVDLRALPAGRRRREVAELDRQYATRPFDLPRGPLLRAALLHEEDDAWTALFCLHHIVSDGWSLGVLVREISALYRAFARGEEAELPELPVQYADFAVWQRAWLAGEALDGLVEHWRGRLAGAPALLELPLDRPRPPVQGVAGAMRPLSLPAELAAGLRAVARREVATPFMVLMAGFQALLARLSGQLDVVVGTPIAGRTHREVEGLIGFFVNTLALRGDLGGDPPFDEIVRRARAAALDAYAHQELPFERLVEELAPERSLAHAPIFQVVMALQNAPGGPLELPDLLLEPLAAARDAVQFDWTLDLTEAADGILGILQYRTDLFDGASVERALAQLATLLAGAAADPGRRLAELPLLSAGERHQLLTEWSGGRETAPPAGDLVHELFAAQAARTPEASAVLGGGRELSYADLDRRSSQLARHLRALGVGPEERVAVQVERSPEMLVALLGVLKAGGAYVPLDPAYPAERLAYLREDCGARVVLTQERLEGRLAAGVGAAAAQTVRLDADWPRISRRSTRLLARAASAGNAAYVIYTSGSTGCPKGTVITHRSLVSYSQGLAAWLGLGAGDRFLQFASLSFDVSVEEIFPALLAGAAVVLRDPAELATGEGLRRAIDEEGVTVVELPTAFWHEWVYGLERSGEQLPESLRWTLVGGETMLPERLAAWRRLDADLVHVFGLTEVTVTSTLHRAERTAVSALLPIGRPFGENRAYVLDGSMRPAPAGVAGELYLGGSGVAREYLGRPELTAERFVPSPYGDPGERLFRTGDLARWLADGNLEFLGRRDRQVKVRGFRIEPGEVEAALAALPGVREALVAARRYGPGDDRLVAYLVADGEVAAPGELQALLGRSLPHYMVPSYFVTLDAFPLSPNGKVDHRALPAPEEAWLGPEAGYVAPRNPLEEVLAGIWSDVLQVERVGVDDSFFALGGHSLLATQLASRVRDAFGVELPLRTVFEQPTVAGVAGVVAELQRSGAGLAAPPIERVPRDGELPLSFAQQRLWFLDQMEPEQLRLQRADARSACER